jgi:hypothetical protein
MKKTTLALKTSKKLKLGKITISKLNTSHLSPILIEGPSSHPVCEFTQTPTVIEVFTF